MILCRHETRCLELKNTSMLPVAYTLSGFDSIGEELECEERKGIVQPCSSFTVPFTLQTAQPLIIANKFLNLEVCLLTLNYIH